MSPAEKKIGQALVSKIQGRTEGVWIRSYYKGKMCHDLQIGTVYPIYDLASLTKIIFTVSNIMLLVHHSDFKLSDPVKKYLDWFPSGETTITHLLTHTSGLPWWRPYYKEIDHIWDRSEKFEQLEKWISAEEIVPAGKAKYSDVGFFTLGLLLEKLLENDLLSIWQNYSDRLGLNEIHFNPENEPQEPVESYAPTEECPIRRIKIQGEVNDENSWFLGGVTPHAGLFGTMDGVCKWTKKIRDIVFGRETEGEFVDFQTLSPFISRYTAPLMGDWAQGFMVPTIGKASCGTRFSAQSFGHLGFTGTSIWIDPKKDLFVVVLSNRTYPNRQNNTFNELRPLIHDLVSDNLS